MWQRGEQLLAFTLITVLHYKVFAVDAVQLDMAPNTVDDQYIGCRDKMLEKVVESGLLSTELEKNNLLKKAWNTKMQCSVLIPGGVKEHTEAMMAYALGGKSFRESFNTAVQTMGGNISAYTNQFEFKSLHFLLIDSMRLLKKQCQIVYHVMPHKYKLEKNSEIRFGRFTSAFSSHSELLEEPDLEDGILFKIKSCLVLKLTENTCKQSEDVELLLSPMEVFKVGNITEVSTIDHSHTEISLIHSRIDSNHDCYLFSRAPNSSTVQSLSRIVLMVVFLFLFVC